ncbi:allophanate hydrolase subunit 1 [Glaciecola sp. SC05]|uniref:5-oxoprolinase subunit B family protein n=1 Tax=Glaciecola sp. SC05 TaxID=1987355 RepID=UPI003529BD21
MFLPRDEYIHGALDKYWLGESVCVHWVNENSCLLQFSSPESSRDAALINANQQVRRWSAALVSQLPNWLENYVPAYTSLLIVYDAELADKFSVLRCLRHIQSITQTQTDAVPNTDTSQQHHTIDVCYSPTLEQALPKNQLSGKTLPNDIDIVSGYSALTIDEVIVLHCQPKYRVFTVGFLPNFAYMGLTEHALNIPRRSSPRKSVPAGAVAIADNQTAIYPQSSPGGWHILGYTPLALGNNAQVQFRAGDTVSFRAISEEDYCQRVSSCD